MENIFTKYFNLNNLLTLSIILFLNLLSIKSQDNSKEGMMNKDWQNLKFAIYFTYGDVEKLLADTTQFRKTMDYFAPVNVKHVYLEGNSRGDINVKLLKDIAKRFHDMGIETTGAMVPVSPKGGPSCYNNREDLASLEKRMRSLVKVFNNIILDDWLFTTCTCDKCLADRGNLNWADYRTKLILKQSKKYIIDPAKQVNPKVKIIIKYPNWYEGHRQNGYDVYNETLQFDKMCVGIETRITDTQDQHIPIYSGYIFQKWWASVDTSKWIGSWLDNYGMKGGENYYVAQVWQAVLAKSPEIILWCAGQLYPTNPSSDVYPHFKDLLPEFDRVAGMLESSERGVPIYLPYGSTGEYNIFGYLGMAGIPLEPVAKFPTENQNAIFTLHSLQDPKLADEMIKRMQDGKDIFLTWKLWQKLQDSEFRNTLSFVQNGGSITSSTFRMREGWQENIVKTDKAFTFPRIETTTWPYVRDVAVVEEDYDLGVLLHAKYLNGNMYVLNMPENEYDLLKLPTEALNMIRRAFNNELGVELNGPGSIGMYLFGQKQYVLYNMNEQSADISLRFTKEVPISGWRELVRDKTISLAQDTSFTRFGGHVISTVSLSLEPYQIAVVQAP